MESTILGLQRDNGKEHGNYYTGVLIKCRVYWVAVKELKLSCDKGYV